jgi:hypothetical protein
MEALLIGGAGLFPSQRAHRGHVHPYVAQLERVFAGFNLRSLDTSRWKLWGVRPHNMPARRIAGCAALLSRHGSPSRLLGVLDARTVRQASAYFAVSAEGYWRDHHDTCAKPASLAPAFIGRSRALEIVINVVLPAAAAAGDAELATKARALYGRLPRPAAYGATRFIENALSSDGERTAVNARRAQGLLALNRDWCGQNGCGRCPLS